MNHQKLVDYFQDRFNLSELTLGSIQYHIDNTPSLYLLTFPELYADKLAQIIFDKIHSQTGF